jgi:hypothetical protein
MARLVLPSRLALKRPQGSFKEAPQRAFSKSGYRFCVRMSDRSRSITMSKSIAAMMPSPNSWRPLTPRRHLATSRSHSFAGQLAGLLHPSGELSFVEMVVLVDVEGARVLALGLGRRDRTQRRGVRMPQS